MIEAHSALDSMSLTDAFCTLRILPRIGSSAWNSLLRASFAVPSAESPSTMNSSECATSDDRQSTSFAGSDDDSRRVLAPLRLFVGARGDARLHLGDDLVEQQRGLVLVVALGRGEARGQLLGEDVVHDLAHGGGAEHFFRLTLELRLGHAHREHGGHAGEDVVLLELVVADLEATGVLVDLRPRAPS